MVEKKVVNIAVTLLLTLLKYYTIFTGRYGHIVVNSTLCVSVSGGLFFFEVRTN